MILVDFIGENFQITDDMVTNYHSGDQDQDLDSKRTTRGELFRNRVEITPEVIIELKPLPKATMNRLMTIARKEKFRATYLLSSTGETFTANFYIGPSSRNPKTLRIHPTWVFDKHTITMTGYRGLNT